MCQAWGSGGGCCQCLEGWDAKQEVQGAARAQAGVGALRLTCLLASRSEGGCDKCQGLVQVLCGSREAGGGGDKREPLHQLDFSLSGNHRPEFLGYKCGHVFKGLGGFQSPSPWRQGDGYDDLFVISVQH